MLRRAFLAILGIGAVSPNSKPLKCQLTGKTIKEGDFMMDIYKDGRIQHVLFRDAFYHVMRATKKL